MSWTEHYRVPPGQTVALEALPSRYEGALGKRDAREQLAALHDRLRHHQRLLYANGRHALLVILQGMDTSGKDSTIRKVFGPVNPQGVRVHNFKQPSPAELAHDFLWRVHRRVPPHGCIGVFNRSHYEDVVVARVKQLVPEDVWQRRYEHINAFERLLYDAGVRVVKLFLHISKDYQRERLQRRLDRPEKHWKFDPGDLVERSRWDDYARAYDAALTRCSSETAPWYVVPAERRWFRNLLVAAVIVETLEALEMAFPAADFDPKAIRID